MIHSPPSPHPFFGCYFLKHEIYPVVQPFLKEYIISASVQRMELSKDFCYVSNFPSVFQIVLRMRQVKIT